MDWWMVRWNDGWVILIRDKGNLTVAWSWSLIFQIRKMRPRRKKWSPSRATLISTVIFILHSLSHLVVMDLKSLCIFSNKFYLFCLRVFQEDYQKCSIFARIVVAILFYLPPYYSFSGGRKTSALLWALYLPLLLTWLWWGLIRRMLHHSGPVLWTVPTRSLCRDFFTMRVRREITFLATELGKWGSRNSSTTEY